MNAIRHIAAAVALCAIGTVPALAQGTTFTNGTFDGGSLSGWQSYGDVLAAGGRVRTTTASTAYDDDALGAGNEGFMNESGTPAVDFFDATSLAGIPLTNFDIDGYAYEGSAIRQDFTAIAGDMLTVTFDWAFSSTDTVNPDFAFLAVNESVYKFVDTGSQYLSGNFLGTFVDAENVSWSWYQSSYTYQASSNGAVSLALGVIDIGDTQYTSQLRFDNIAVSAVPEPESYALMLAGLGLVGGYVGRRQKKAAAAQTA